MLLEVVIRKSLNNKVNQAPGIQLPGWPSISPALFTVTTRLDAKKAHFETFFYKICNYE